MGNLVLIVFLRSFPKAKSLSLDDDDDDVLLFSFQGRRFIN